MDNDHVKEEVLIAPDKFAFPFAPYKIQLDFMKVMYETIELKKLGIFESPTGTGKSLSIACSSLQWLKDHEDRKISTLMKKIEELKVKKEMVIDDDWINEQYSVKLYNDKINSTEEELVTINKYKEQMNNIKLKKKIIKPKNNFQSLTSEANVNYTSEFIEDSDYIINDEENLVEEEFIEEENQKNTLTQIIFASRTHSQLSQMVNEISKSPHNNIRVVTLASRQTYCLNTSVKSLKHNFAVNEKCLELQKNKCSKVTNTDELNKVIKKKKLRTEKSCAYKNSNNVAELCDTILSDIVDVEDLIKEGKSLTACPYYASRAALKNAQFIALPYQTLLCKRTREISGVNLKDNVVIIDEAHNLLDSIANIHSAIVFLEQIEFALKALQAYQRRYGSRLSPKNYLHFSQLIFVTKRLLSLFDKIDKSKIYSPEDFTFCGEIDNINLIPLIKLCEANNFIQKVAGYAMQYPNDLNNTFTKEVKKTGVKEFLKQIQTNKISTSKKNVLKDEETKVEEIIKTTDSSLSLINCLYSLIAFLTRLTDRCTDGRILISKENETPKFYMKYLLLNPRMHFQEIIKDARAVIVAGGTMQPFEDFTLQLFGPQELHRVNTFSCGHVVPTESLCPIIISKGPSGKSLRFNFSNRSNPDLMQDLSMIIHNICNLVPGGIVCFFPSYQYEQQIYDFLQRNNMIEIIEKKKKIFREPKQSNQVENILLKYTKCINDFKNNISNLSGALMLGIVGGKVSEGLNFSDDLGRCVIIVGMPYSNKTSVELNEKISFMNKNLHIKAGDEYYENLCFKAVNQCIGRAIRHIQDYAAIVLIDERYADKSNYNKLSKWIQSSLKIPSNFPQCFGLLKAFFNTKNRSN